MTKKQLRVFEIEALTNNILKIFREQYKNQIETIKLEPFYEHINQLRIQLIKEKKKKEEFNKEIDAKLEAFAKEILNTLPLVFSNPKYEKVQWFDIHKNTHIDLSNSYLIRKIINVIDEDRNVIPNMDNHYTYEYTFKHEIKELITLQSIDGIDVNTISETIVSKMMEKYCPKQTKLEAAE